ncbi:MAG: Na/Pi cotransporter family protein [Coriobacteriales bacterium]|nr:Na/Pi cotransporter family protein [Coriobacteriales bacterium]
MLSGVALFLFGMTLMGDGLKRVSGNKLEPILYKLSSSPIRGMLLGAGVTTVIQSSSATSVMAVGFVNSGMMTIRQAIPVILGAILGTSITGWIICLSYIEGGEGIGSILSTSTLTGIIAVVGVFLRVFSKKQSHHHVGDIMMGFAILMFGMSTMSGSVRSLGEEPWFTEMLVAVEAPVLGIVIGLLFCALLQSASAAVGIVQALSVTGAMTLGSTLPLLMGISIGASLPVLLTALGASVAGRRTAFSYLVATAMGALSCAVIFYALNAVFNFPIMGETMSPFSLALVNTLLRLAMVCLLLPLIGVLEAIVCRIIPDKAAPAEAEEEYVLPKLEQRFLDHPTLALEQSRSAINEMAVQAAKSVSLAMVQHRAYDEPRRLQIEKLEDVGDRFEDTIGSYLMELSRSDLTEQEGRELSIYLRALTDLERISDHARNISENAAEAHRKGIDFTEDALVELTVLGTSIHDILNLTVDSVVSNDVERAKRVEPLEEVIDGLCDEMKLRHIERLKERQCTIAQGTTYNDLLVDFERVADHCSNIAIAVIELAGGSLAAHEYLDQVKETRSPEFDARYQEYRAQYALQDVPAVSAEVTEG